MPGGWELSSWILAWTQSVSFCLLCLQRIGFVPKMTYLLVKRWHSQYQILQLPMASSRRAIISECCKETCPPPTPLAELPSHLFGQNWVTWLLANQLLIRKEDWLRPIRIPPRGHMRKKWTFRQDQGFIYVEEGEWVRDRHWVVSPTEETGDT